MELMQKYLNNWQTKLTVLLISLHFIQLEVKNSIINPTTAKMINDGSNTEFFVSYDHSCIGESGISLFDEIQNLIDYLLADYENPGGYLKQNPKKVTI